MAWNPSTIDTGHDVTRFLAVQHEQIRAGFAQVAASSGEERLRSFTALRRLLAVHETAEEEIVHPRARTALPDGPGRSPPPAWVRNKRSNVPSQRWRSKASPPRHSQPAWPGCGRTCSPTPRPRSKFEFSELAATLDAEQLAMMRRAVELAEGTAPSHPHPHLTSAAANRLAGPFAAMLDRAREAITGKR